MKDLNLLLENAKHVFDTLDIEYGNVTKIEVNYRAKTRWGQCRKKNGSYTININSRLLEDDILEDKVMSTVLHELLHTVNGCMNHGHKWQSLAELINDCYSCYDITRTTSYDFFGISREERLNDFKYTIRCEKCGQVLHRHKMFDTHRYSCGRCHTNSWKVVVNW